MKQMWTLFEEHFAHFDVSVCFITFYDICGKISTIEVIVFIVNEIVGIQL